MLLQAIDRQTRQRVGARAAPSGTFPRSPTTGMNRVHVGVVAQDLEKTKASTEYEAARELTGKLPGLAPGECPRYPMVTTAAEQRICWGDILVYDNRPCVDKPQRGRITLMNNGPTADVRAVCNGLTYDEADDLQFAGIALYDNDPLAEMQQPLAMGIFGIFTSFNNSTVPIRRGDAIGIKRPTRIRLSQSASQKLSDEDPAAWAQMMRSADVPQSQYKPELFPIKGKIFRDVFDAVYIKDQEGEYSRKDAEKHWTDASDDHKRDRGDAKKKAEFEAADKKRVACFTGAEVIKRCDNSTTKHFGTRQCFRNLFEVMDALTDPGRHNDRDKMVALLQTFARPEQHELRLDRFRSGARIDPPVGGDEGTRDFAVGLVRFVLAQADLLSDMVRRQTVGRAVSDAEPRQEVDIFYVQT